MPIESLNIDCDEGTSPPAEPQAKPASFIECGLKWSIDCLQTLRPGCITLCCPATNQEQEITDARTVDHGTTTVESNNGINVQVDYRDFVIPRASFRLGAEVVTPKVGYILKLEKDGELHSYEIRGRDRLPFREYSDSSCCEWLIRTTLCGTETIVS